MPLKKQNYTDEEIPIFDEACIYKRGVYWHFRMWLNNERKYARKSIRTRSKTTAIEKGKAAYLEIYANLQQGKSYFSITTKERVWRSECYMRTPRFKRVKPSVGIWGGAICASKLQHHGRCMTATERHTQLGKRFIELGEQCDKKINNDAVG